MKKQVEEFIDKQKRRHKLENRKEDLEAAFKHELTLSTKAGVKNLLDFALRVSRHNGYSHDLVILPSDQYRAVAGATAGVPVEDVETSQLRAKMNDEDVYIAHSYEVDALTLVDLDDWPEPEDLSQ